MDLLTLHNLYLLLALVGAGIVAGYSSGLFGIGGGVVLVPALLTLLPYLGAGDTIVMHSAVGTCLALIIPAGVMASRKQYQMGMLDLGLLKKWLPGVMVGVLAGSILIKYVPTQILKIIFTTYLVLVTGYAVLEKGKHLMGEGRPSGISKYVIGFFIGGLSVLLGIGGGTFTVPYCKITGYPMKKSIALSTATSLFIGLGGALGSMVDGWGNPDRAHLSLGFINLPAFLIITPIVMYFAPLGSRTANALPEKELKWVYAAFLATVSGYMLFKLFR